MKAIWIEIPVRDLHRAKHFYETVFGHDPTDIQTDEVRSICVYPGDPAVSLNRTEGFTPGPDGVLPYFHLDDLDTALRRVVAAGGQVVQGRSERPGLGYFALVLDPEGNRLTLHANQ